MSLCFRYASVRCIITKNVGVTLPKKNAPGMWAGKKCYNLVMVGTTLVFNKRAEVGRDGMNNPTYENVEVSIDNCLIAPMHEPENAREQQGNTDTRERLRIHLPKTSTDDVSGSTVVWDGKTYQVDNSSVKFMDENTPGQWNRYFMAEAVNG